MLFRELSDTDQAKAVVLGRGALAAKHDFATIMTAVGRQMQRFEGRRGPVARSARL